MTKIVVETTFHKNLTWSISVCGIKGIRSHTFDMADTYNLKKKNIFVVFDTARNLRFCKGILFAEMKLDAINNQSEILREMFTLQDDDSNQVVRSVNCNNVLNFRSHNSIQLCSICKCLLQSKENNCKSTSCADLPLLAKTNILKILNPL